MAQDTLVEIKCRLCLEKGLDMVDILSVERMSEKVHSFLQIEVNSSDPWVCVICVNNINNWESYYDHVRGNEVKLQALKAAAAETNPGGVIYGVDTICIKGEDGQEGGDSTMEKYTVMCVPDVDELQNLNQSEAYLEEIVEEQQVVDEEYVSMEQSSLGPEDADADDPEEDGDTTADAEEDESIEEPKPKETEKPPERIPRTRQKEKKPLLTAAVDYLGTREEQDELIRDTVSLDCDVCFLTSHATFEDLLEHYKDAHDNAKGYVKCCQKTFKRRYVLLEHVRLHLNPNQYACPTCHKRFSTKRHLADHEVLHIPEEERRFECDKCHRKYATSGRLTVHMRSHNEENSFPCYYCPKGFRQEQILKNHIRAVHESCNQHICEICAKVFKTKEGFQMHQVQHLDVPPERLKCEVCGGMYKNKESLRYHMLLHKRVNERYYCDVCNKEFKSKKRLGAHKKYVHAPENQLYQCSMCDKAFKRPIVLKEHMAAHTGTALYRCSFCPKQFNSNANKYSHQKAQHPAEWEQARQQRMAVE